MIILCNVKESGYHIIKYSIIMYLYIKNEHLKKINIIALF